MISDLTRRTTVSKRLYDPLPRLDTYTPPIKDRDAPMFRAIIGTFIGYAMVLMALALVLAVWR